MKKMRINTIVCIMLALALVLSNLAGLDLGIVEAHAEAQSHLGGEGTEEKPYEISDYAGLKEFATIVNEGNTSAYAKLMNDIVCTDKTWTPIGYYNYPDDNAIYIGHFDGKKYKIIGLSNAGVDNKDSMDYQGLFGYIGKDSNHTGTVENVCLEDSDIHGHIYVGGVAGYNKGTIENSYNTGAVTGQGSNVGGITGVNEGTITKSYNTGAVTGDVYVGGVAGYNYIGTITKSYNTGVISGLYDVGGVVGKNYKRTITKSYNTGAVTGQHNFVGGVAGENLDGTISNCNNAGAVSGQDNNVGGVVGFNSSGNSIGTITKSYNTGTVTGQDLYVGGVAGQNYGAIENSYNTGTVSGENYVGGIVGYNSDGTSKNSYNIGVVSGEDEYSRVGGVVGSSDAGTFTNCYYDTTICKNITAVYNKQDTENVTGLSTDQMTGNDSNQNVLITKFVGTGASPWLFKENDANNYFYPHLNGVNFEAIDVINNHNATVEAKYWPARRLNKNGGITKPYEISDYNMLKQFSDIVNEYDEGSHTYPNKAVCAVLTNDIICTDKSWTPIGDCNSNNNISYTGHFNGKGYIIKGLSNKEVVGIDSKNWQGLFGIIGNEYNNIGTVENVCLEDSDIRGDDYVGGLTGFNNGTIKDCYNTGEVIGQGTEVGGVVGYNRGTIKDCYNTGSVTGEAEVGGVVGANIESITNCYNTGSVTGLENYIGGVAGLNWGGNIINCYNTGAIFGQGTNAKLGGVAGYNDNTEKAGTIKNCYFDKNRSNTTDAIAKKADTSIDVNVKVLTTAQMTGPNALSRNNMYFPAPDGDTTYASPWIMKADYIDGDKFIWYYPHLTGFERDEEGEVITNPKDITNWPAYIEGQTEYTEPTSYVYTGSAIYPTITKIVVGDKTYTSGFSVKYCKLDSENNWVELDSGDDCVNAGTYCAKIEGHEIKEFAITPKTVKVTADSAEKTYGDGEPAFNYNSTALLNNDSFSGSLTREEGENTGTYTINQGSLTAGGNYTIDFTGATFTINAKEISDQKQNIKIELSPENITYDGTAKEPSVTVKDGDKTVDSKEYQVSYANNENAGTATVTVSDKDGGNYIVSGTKTFEIKEAEAAIDKKPSAINNLTYNGKSQALINAGTAKDNQKVVYALGSDAVNVPTADAEGTPDAEKKWKESAPSATNAGTYYVWYKVAVDKNHKFEDEKAGCLTITISRKSVTVTADNKTKDSGTTDETLTATVSGLEEGDTPDLIAYSLNREAGETAGTYAITVTGAAEQNNYTVSFVPGTYTINARKDTDSSNVSTPDPIVNVKTVVTETDDYNLTVTTIINADKSVTEKSIKEFKNGNTTTKITLTDNSGKTILTASEAVSFRKSGTKIVTTNITDNNGYNFRNQVTTTKAGKETIISETTNRDKSSSYVKMVTKPNGKVTRNSVKTDTEGNSVITIGTYMVDPSTFTSVSDMIIGTFELHTDSLPEDASALSELTYEVTSAGKAKLIRCNTVQEEITVPSKVRINGKTYTVYAVAKSAFKGCDTLKKVKLGKSITTIGTKAFADLENMEEIILLSTSKDGVKVNKNAFAGISSEARFYSKASAEARKKTLKRIKKSGYKTITEVTKI